MCQSLVQACMPIYIYISHYVCAVYPPSYVYIRCEFRMFRIFPRIPHTSSWHSTIHRRASSSAILKRPPPPHTPHPPRIIRLIGHRWIRTTSLSRAAHVAARSALSAFFRCSFCVCVCVSYCLCVCACVSYCLCVCVCVFPIACVYVCVFPIAF